MADEDDLYADLYNEDIVGNTSVGSAGQSQSQQQDGQSAKRETETADNKQQAARASFIPPPPAASSAPAGAAAVTSSSSSTSFIPPPSAASTVPRNTGSFIPPAPQQQRMGSSTIDTAPATNTDDARRGGGMATGSMASSSSMAYQSNNEKPLLPHEMPDEGKLFVGGLNWDTTDAGLKQYFTQFGKVDHCLIMRDPNTGRSRGFAFLTFADPKAVNSVMVKEHYLDGKMIDPKRAIPRQENVRTAKCFVGGVPSSATADSFRAYFAQFGNVLDSTLMMDRETQKPRGYGFVTYDNDSTVERLLQMGSLSMDGKMIEVKRATPRTNDGARRPAGRDGMTGANTTAISNNNNSMGDAYGMGNNAMASMMNNPMFGNAMSNQQFDPNALAQFFQQQGMGGAGAGAFNPMMMQQMMMGGMGGWGAGAGNPWMAMGGMGGMGFGGMSGPMSLSPTLGQGQFRSPSMQQQGGAMSGSGGQSGGSGSGGGSMRNASSGSAGAQGAGGMRASSSENDSRHGRRSSANGTSGSLPNRPSGLPSRPGDNSGSGYNSGRAGSANEKSGRDYQRERSPERGSARYNSNGSNNRW